MLTESTITKQVQIVFSEGAPAFIFRETENRVLRDGEVIASTTHRESYPTDSDEAKAVFGDLASAATAALLPYQSEVQRLAGELEIAKTELAALKSILTA